jgi:hypothetical protein
MATKNDASAKGDSIKTIFPFKLDIITSKNLDSEGRPTYKTALNFHSKLYDSFKVPSDGGEQYLTIKKIKINNLSFEQEIPALFYDERYYYCILEVEVSDLKAVSSTIKFVLGNKKLTELYPIVFQSADNLRQTKARVILAIVAYDDKDAATNALITNNNNQSIPNSNAYVIQCVQSNLLMTNMVFNGVPVVYPVPFPGSTTSLDGSDQLE